MTTLGVVDFNLGGQITLRGHLFSGAVIFAYVISWHDWLIFGETRKFVKR